MKSKTSHPVPTSLGAMLLLLLPFLEPTITLAESQTNDRRGLEVSEGTVNAWPRKGGVGRKGWSVFCDPAEIVIALSKRDDLNSDVTTISGNEAIFVFGSMTDMAPGQSLAVTATFVQDANQTASEAPMRTFQMATEIVVGIAKTDAKKSYTLYNLIFDRVSVTSQ